MSILARKAEDSQRAPDPEPSTAAVSSIRRGAYSNDVERESARLAALEDFDVLDTPREDAFDRVVRLTKALVGVPVALLSFIDGHRQWFKSCHGVTNSETPRELTFCNHVISERQSIVVPNATLDPRFAANPYVVGEPGIRAYIGVPLRTSSGHDIGTLCAVDFRPRDFGPEQVGLLTDLARLTMDQLELRLVATTDSLTGALSRHTFKQEASRAVALALRHHHDLSCIVIDLDHFKRINDAHGHAAGDIVLSRSVKACIEQLRQTDLMGRMGGEEFAVLLPNTGMNGALEVAEKLRRAVESLELEIGPAMIACSASFGVASLDGSARDVETLLGNADSALYEAKAAGRNRCVVWRSPQNEARSQRRRVLKGGRIVFNGGMSSLDCTVRSLSDESAGLDVSSTVGVPKRFDLLIKADGFEKPCRLLSQTERHIEAEFC